MTRYFWVSDSNSEDASFQQSIAHAIADVSVIHGFTRQQTSRRKPTKRKPGPKPKSVRLKFFLLPDGCELPKFSQKENPSIPRLQNAGYGNFFY